MSSETELEIVQTGDTTVEIRRFGPGAHFRQFTLLRSELRDVAKALDDLALKHGPPGLTPVKVVRRD